MTSEGSGQNGTKTSVLSEWLTSSALRIALTEMIRSSVNTWCEVTEKCLVFLIADVIIQSKKKQFDSISEVVWTLPNYLLLIFRQFHVNNDDITIVMRPACKHVWSIHSHGIGTGLEERLVCIGYFKTLIFDYEFKDISSYGLWHTSQARRKLNMKVPKSKSEWGLQHI